MSLFGNPTNLKNDYRSPAVVFNKREANKLVKTINNINGINGVSTSQSIASKNSITIRPPPPKVRRFEINKGYYEDDAGYIWVGKGKWCYKGIVLDLETDSDVSEYGSSTERRTLSVTSGEQFVVLRLSNEADPEADPTEEPDTLKVSLETQYPEESTPEEQQIVFCIGTVYTNSDGVPLWIDQYWVGDINAGASTATDLTEVYHWYAANSEDIYVEQIGEENWAEPAVGSICELQKGGYWLHKSYFDYENNYFITEYRQKCISWDYVPTA
jgi:hypothetical protein